jgi:hypothetical protein
VDLLEAELLFSEPAFSEAAELSLFELSALPSPEDDELEPLPLAEVPFDDFLA